jgi:hypothetical protein
MPSGSEATCGPSVHLPPPATPALRVAHLTSTLLLEQILLSKHPSRCVMWWGESRSPGVRHKRDLTRKQISKRCAHHFRTVTIFIFSLPSSLLFCMGAKLSLSHRNRWVRMAENTESDMKLWIKRPGVPSWLFSSTLCRDWERLEPHIHAPMPSRRGASLSRWPPLPLPLPYNEQLHNFYSMRQHTPQDYGH